MDQSQEDKKSPNIWNKFESAAPGVPDWIQNKEQTSNILQTLLKTIPAKAVLISTTSDVFLLVGELDDTTQKRILQVLGHFWDSVQKSDLTRYLKNEQGEVTGFIFCANLFQQLILTVYYQDTPTLSMARAHTKRITRALSGQTVASYEAKTIPVDAAVAAQMRKFYEQLAKQKEGGTEANEELPKANVGPSTAEPVETPIIDSAPQTEPELDPQDSVLSDILTEEESRSEEFLPSMDDLLGDPVDTKDVDISTSAVIEEIENQPAAEPAAQDAVSADAALNEVKEIKIDFQGAGIDTDGHEIEEISDEDLALLSDELDDFFMDDDSDIDLEEQKEKLAALLQEMPTPDPDGEPMGVLPQEDMADLMELHSNRPEEAQTSTQSDSSSNGDFTLPWEGESSQNRPETAPVDVEAAQTASPEPANFQQATQQTQEKAESGARPFTIILLPRIQFHELGLPFEKKFDHYFRLICEVIDCEADSTQIFSDHVQLKLNFSGKGSVARTIMQIKKLLELKIIENYSTLTEDLGGQELWIPGQLLFGENEKVDSKRIQEFIKNAQS